MAIKVMVKVWEHFPRGGSQLLGLLALADWSDDEGRCWPSISSIADKMRLSEKQARRVIHELIDEHYVEVTGFNQGGVTSRRYQIKLDMLPPPTTGSPPVDVLTPSHAQEPSPPTHGSRTVIDTTKTVMFEKFWAAYPKKKSKGAAEKAFKALKIDDALLKKMVAAVTAAKETKEWLKDSGQFIPYPATWLRNRAWEDDMPTQGDDDHMRGVI